MSSSDTQWFYECSCISWYWKLPLVKCLEEGRKTVEPVLWLSGSTDLTLVECERAETVTIFGSERSRQHVRVAKLCCVDLATCSLWANSPGRSGGGTGKGRELATTPLEFEFHPQFHLQFPCGSPTPRRLSCQISANQREAETNIEKHVSGVMLQYGCHLPQLAFRIDFSDADNQIPET